MPFQTGMTLCHSPKIKRNNTAIYIMSPYTHYPVIIIGGGPAGSGAALFLGKHKIRHLVLEKAAFPREKICGDGLTPKVLHVLKKLDENMGAHFRQHEDFNGSFGGVVTAPNGKVAEFVLTSPGAKHTLAPLWVCKRKDFDAFLHTFFLPDFTTCRYAAVVTEIHRSAQDDKIILTYTCEGQTEKVSCDIIIGADGDRSIVKKTFAPQKKDPAHYCASIRAYFSGIKNLHEQKYMEFLFLEGLMPGYFWIFPLPDGTANVGIGMMSDYVSKHKINLRETFLKLIATHPDLKERFSDAKMLGNIAGWGIPMGSKLGTLAGKGFMLTGDAASLVDPASGEGVGNALYSGMLAADAAKLAIEKNDFSAAFFHQHYTKRVKRTMGGELKFSTYLQYACEYPRLINWFIRKAPKNALLMDTLKVIFDNEIMGKRLRSPMFYVRLIAGFW